VATTSNAAGKDASRDQLLSQLSRLNDKSAQVKFLTEHPELLTAEAVSWLSDLIRDQSKVNTTITIPLAQVAMMIAGKLRNRPALARSLRAMGNALYVSGQNKSAVVYHEKARRMFALLGNRHELARTLSASTQPLILTGQYRRALANAKQARRIFSTLHDRGRVARLDVNIGNIFHRQDRFAEALKWYRRAHRHFLDDAARDPEGMAVALHNIAMSLVSLNDFRGALAAHQEARRIAEEHSMHVLVGQADYNIAAMYYLRGELSRAIRMLLATREDCRKTNDQYHIALCTLDLSEIYLQLNLAGPAEEMAQEASAGFQRLGMGYEAGKSLVNLALAMARQNKPTPALEMLAQARRQFIAEKNSAWPSLIDLYQAAILIEQARYPEAQQLCLHAVKFFRTAHIPSKLILCQLLLAQSYLLAQKPQMAKRQCSAALAALDVVELPLLSCRAQQLMGRIHLTAGSKREAYDHYQKARDLLERTRTDLHTEEMKISLTDDKLEIYEGLVQLCLEPSSGGPDLEEAFEYIEESKSRVLRDLMSLPESEESTANGDSETQQKLLDLRAQINWYSHQLVQEQLRGPSASKKAMLDLQAAIHKRESGLLRMVREKSLKALPAALSSSQPATLTEIRETLPRDCTLVEYFHIRDRLLAAILTHEGLEIVPVTRVQLVAPLFDRLQFQLDKFRLGADYVNTFGESLLKTTQQHLTELHDKLLAPVEKQLKGQHLVIVPHGILHRLPFTALFDGQQYLIDKFSVSYAPSATVYSLCCRRPINRRGPALVMGVPDAAAPLISDEAKAVAEIVPGAELFLNERATAEVLQNKGINCRFIHIATHGFFRQNNPMFSGIRLGDSIFSLLDLYRLKLPAELITLSGCTTGLSTVRGGDELLGLVRGLIYAGAGSALLTLWDVDDRSTVEFMSSFYRHLSSGVTKALALQKAARNLRERYPHPHYWAAFSLVGNVSS
jgi:CHAT domain-containing protein/tetratricopeptide (TPR) repeat protein